MPIVVVLLLLAGCTTQTNTDEGHTDIIWCVGACIHATQGKERETVDTTVEGVEEDEQEDESP